MVDVLERQLYAGFGACKRHNTVISKVLTGISVLVLLGSAMFNKKYPGMLVYSVLVALLMSFIELLPLLARIDTRRQPALKGFRGVMVTCNELCSPLKKCLIYGVLGLFLFLHLTLATYGGVMVLVAIPFIAAQYNDSPDPTGEESPSLEETSDCGPIEGAVIADTVRACDLQVLGVDDLVPAPRPPFDTPSFEVVSEKDDTETPDQEWEEVDDNDVNLLLG